MQRDAADIIDRWSIAKLKAERIGTTENRKEYAAFDAELEKLIKKHPQYKWTQFTKMMLDINDFIWQLEAGTKSGKERLSDPYYLFDDTNEKVLAKIGACSILLRNFNHIRIGLKNIINELTKEGFQDTKKNHISE